MKRIFHLLLPFLVSSFSVGLQAQCLGTQQDYRECEGDTLLVTVPFCTGCTYSWSPFPSVPSTSNTAKYFIPDDSTADWSSQFNILASVNDPINVCQYGEGVEIWITHIQDFHIQDFNGPWTGDTSQVYTYVFQYYYQIGSNPYEQYPSWVANGGTVQNVVTTNQTINMTYPFWDQRTDTVYVKWNTVNNPELQLNIQTLDHTNNLSNINLLPLSCFDTVRLPLGPPATPVDGSAYSCSSDTFSYTTAYSPNASYVWSVTGGTIVSGQGTDSIRVAWPSNFSGGSVQVDRTQFGQTFSSPSFTVSAPSYPPNFLGPDVQKCPNGSVTLDATGTFGHLYSWSDGSAASTTLATMPLPYSVTVTDTLCGVTSMDTILVSDHVPVQPSLGPDASFCMGDSVLLDAGTGFTSYLWSTGDITQSIWVFNSGTYIVVTTDQNGCTGSDTINVTVHPNPVVSLGPDVDLCPNDSILLDAGPLFVNYLWFNGATTQTTYVFGPGIYWVEVMDINGCIGRDTIIVNGLQAPNVNLGQDTILCADTTITLDATVPTLAAYVWNTNQTTSSIVVSQGGLYAVDVTGVNGCVGQDSITITALPDCVFPGDADYDGLADNNDVLAIGVALGSTGPARPNPSLAWYGQEATDWTGSLPLPSTANYKQVDTNGDALIDDNDTLAISLNYGNTHNKTNGIQTGGNILQITADFDSVTAGDTAIYTISLGDSVNNADSVFGIAFTINYDTSIADTNGLFFVNYDDCWFAPSGNRLDFTYDLYPSPLADVAVVRRSGPDTSGHGEVCRLGIVTIENISGKKDILTKPMIVSLTDITLINKEMISLSVGGSTDSTIVVDNEVAIGGPLPQSKLVAYPVPAQSSVYLLWEGKGIEEVEVFDIKGKSVAKHAFNGSERVRMDVSGLVEGLYILRAKGFGVSTTMKLPVIHR